MKFIPAYCTPRSGSNQQLYYYVLLADISQDRLAATTILDNSH